MLQVVNFKNTVNIPAQQKKKDYTAPALIGSAVLSTIGGYSSYKLNKEEALTNKLIEYKKNLTENSVLKNLYDFIQKRKIDFYCSNKYDEITSTEEIVKKFDDGTLKLEDFLDEADLKLVEKECKELEEKLRKEPNEFINKLKENINKTKKNYLLTGLGLGIAIGSAILIEKNLEKNENKSNKLGTMSLLAGTSFLGGLAGLLKNLKENPSNQYEEIFISDVEKMTEIEMRIKNDFMQNRSQKLVDRVKTCTDEEKIEKYVKEAENYLQKINDYTNNKIDDKEMFGSYLDDINNEIKEAEFKLRNENIEKAKELCEKFNKLNKKAIGIGATIGFAIGLTSLLIKNLVKNNKKQVMSKNEN